MLEAVLLKLDRSRVDTLIQVNLDLIQEIGGWALFCEWALFREAYSSEQSCSSYSSV